MYDDGNEVYFTANGFRREANYNQNYNGSGWTFLTLPVHPFIAFFTIATNSRDDSVYIIEVTSNLGADGEGTFQNFSGSLSLNGLFLEFQGIQVFGADDPSVCEVYFYIHTERRSGGIFEFESPRQDRQFIRSTAKVRNHLGSGMLGYVLLSTEPDREITQEELNATMLNVLQLVSVETIEMPSNVTITNTTISAFNTTYIPVRILANATRVFQERLRSANLERHIQNFYSYRYDDRNPQTMISDGGNDMYDDGNMVYFIVDNVTTLVNYSQIYEGPGYTFSTLPNHPFIAFFTLANFDDDKVYTIEVRSNLGADGSGTFHNFFGSLSHNGFILKFKGVQVYGAGDASVCEVYFYIVQQGPNEGTFEFESPRTDREYIRSIASVRNHTNSGMLGYILLSTEPDRKITKGELNATMLNVLQLVSMDVLGTYSPMPSPEVSTNTTTTTETTDPKLTKPSPSSGIVDTALRAISSNSESILSHIPGFYPYKYDGTSYNIRDGGQDMYDTGNIVKFSSDGTSFTRPINYNTTNVTDTHEIGIFAGHPFTTLAWIKDVGSGSKPGDFRFDVSGHAGADGSGGWEQFNNSIYDGSTEIRYHVAQLHGASDPSICEVYFVITDQRWGPTGHYEFDYPSIDSSRDRLQTSVRISGTVRNMFFGYTLFSDETWKVSQTQVAEALNEMMLVIVGAVEPLLVQPTTQSAADELFLSSCTAKVAVNSIFRCDAIFSKQAKRFKGPDSCRSVLDQLFRCVSFQTYQCYQGWKENYFDTLVPSNFNSEVLKLLFETQV
uniref:Uncharacterized protein LOC104266555 n=1 Tax=Phallusia mammillata TaxID=59560 RepID=A0A6F9DJY9_9ASCI|nr:uncharacterized protein LOC104266555 [Phallusia mammillata]